MINLIRFGLFSSLLAFSVTEISASEKVSRLDECASQVKSYYKKHAQPSDVARGFDKKEILLAGKPLLSLQNHIVTSFESDKLVYVGTGSYHSGYFVDAIVANPENCQVEDIINMYSE
jgi:hypothetical protein